MNRFGFQARIMRKPIHLRIREGCQRSRSERREHRPVPPG